MKAPVSDIAFTPSVKAQQERLGSRKSYAVMEQRGGWSDVITADLAAFIAERDSFYLGTASAQGQPRRPFNRNRHGSYDRRRLAAGCQVRGRSAAASRRRVDAGRVARKRPSILVA